MDTVRGPFQTVHVIGEAGLDQRGRDYEETEYHKGWKQTKRLGHFVSLFFSSFLLLGLFCVIIVA